MPYRIVLVEKASCVEQVWDASPLTCWFEQSSTDIAEIRLRSGRQVAKVSDLFDLTSEACEEDQLLLHTKRIVLNSLGASLSNGVIKLFGRAGNQTAADMKAGSITIHGDVGHNTAAGMHGGTLVIEGNVGDGLGGVSMRSGRGMRGGDVLISGSAGSYVGQRMRRGVICIGGDAADHGADRMIAGTIVVLGKIGQFWGHAMKRGSIILAKESSSTWHAELSEAHEYELSFLPLLWKHLLSMNQLPSLTIPTTRWAKRRVGDLALDGKGEVLTLTRIS